MQQQELKEGTSVFTPDGDELGEINRFVLDPETHKVTHTVIRAGWLLTEDKVVPFDMVSTTEGGLVLSDKIQDLDQLPPFKDAHYVEISDRDREAGEMDNYPSGPAYYWYPPFGDPGYPAYGLGRYGFPPADTGQNVPTGTMALQEGIGVLSSDGELVGLVKRLLVDELSDEVTHFLISENLSFKEHKLVPARWVRSVTEDLVRLHVSSQLLERLPAYERE
jgi:uncharacterized protein YrrD